MASSGRAQKTRSALRRTATPRRAALDLGDAPRAAMPRRLSPMLATLVDRPFDRPAWLFEPKWDGFRAIARIEQRRVELYSRNNLSFNERFPALIEPLGQLNYDAILDGEVVVLDSAGKSQFQLLQNYQRTGEGRLVYYVFDMPYLDGHDLRRQPLVRRKRLLRRILPRRGPVHFSDHIEQHGLAFFRAAAQQGLEGIIAKRADSTYQDGRRSEDWLKIKTRMRQEAVIAGFTDPRGSRAHLGALVLGVYEGDQLVYIGHTGTGFDGKTLQLVRSKLDPLVQPTCPFQVCPKTNAPVRWVQPKLVCEVSFSEWTADGQMRHPVFLGLREDKSARAVQHERPKPAAAVVNKK